MFTKSTTKQDDHKVFPSLPAQLTMQVYQVRQMQRALLQAANTSPGSASMLQVTKQT